jgi:hypothetical protein
MSIAKHTPGPWEARTFLVRGGVRMSDTICHVGSSTSLPPNRSHETEANARLIAAAPDMLAALKAMVLNDTHTYRDCHKAALAAIARATA